MHINMHQISIQVKSFLQGFHGFIIMLKALLLSANSCSLLNSGLACQNPMKKGNGGCDKPGAGDEEKDIKSRVQRAFEEVFSGLKGTRRESKQPVKATISCFPA
jgi:hypothetical protein